MTAGIALSVPQGGSRDLTRHLAGGELDFALIVLPLPKATGCWRSSRCAEELVVARGRGGAAGAAGEVAIGDLRARPR